MGYAKTYCDKVYPKPPWLRMEGDGEEYGEVEEEDIEATEGEGVGGGVVNGEIVKT